jgi:hypothetical protein
VFDPSAGIAAVYRKAMADHIPEWLISASYKRGRQGGFVPERPPIESLAPMTPLHAKTCYNCV